MDIFLLKLNLLLLKDMFFGVDMPEEYRKVYRNENILDLLNKLLFFNIVATVIGIIYLSFQFVSFGKEMIYEDYGLIIIMSDAATLFFSVSFFILVKKYEEANGVISAFIILFFIFVSAASTWVTVFQSRISLTKPLLFMFVLVLSSILLCFDMYVNTVILTLQEIIYAATLILLSGQIKFLTESIDNIINSIFVLILSYYIVYLINSNKRKNFALGESIKEKIGMLENVVNIDPLTGIMNRRAFDRYLPTELDRCKKGRLIFAVMIVDVDDFTAYNDAVGLLQGDYCLIKIANAIQSSLSRSTDKLFRFNSKQFALIFPGASVNGCEVVASRVLNVVRELKIAHEDGPYEIITVSIGVFTETMNASSKITPAEIMSLAGNALENAKSSGKNNFTVHDNNKVKKQPDENA